MILLAVEPVDMRKSFNGLHAVVAQVLEEDPTSGTLFLFSNRKHDRPKSCIGIDQDCGYLINAWSVVVSAGLEAIALKAEAL